MPIKTLSTRRTQAASAISSSAVSFNNPDGSGFAISGTGVTSNTTIKSVPVTVGLSSAASTTTVSPPVITSFNVASDSSYTTILDDTAIDTGGAYIKINGTNFSNTGLLVYFNGSNVTNTYISSNEVRATIPATSAGSYNLMMFNGSRGAILTNVTVSGFPSWTTTSYTSYSWNVSVQLVASGDAPLTYSLYSGTLPTGLTLSANGLISGTATSDSVTSNLVFLVNDAQNQTTQQTISLTISTIDSYWKYTSLLLTGENSAIAATTAYNLDSSDNNFVITVNGDATPTRYSPFASPTSSDGSTYFDGTGDYYNIASNTAFAFGTGNFTIEFWIYHTTAPDTNNRCVFNTNTNGFFLQMRNTAFGIGVPGVAENNAFSYTFAGNTWYHIAVSRSGTTVYGFEIGRAHV